MLVQFDNLLITSILPRNDVDLDHKVCKTHVKAYHIDWHQQTMLNNCFWSLSQQPQAFHDVKKFTLWKWTKSSGELGFCFVLEECKQRFKKTQSKIHEMMSWTRYWNEKIPNNCKWKWVWSYMKQRMKEKRMNAPKLMRKQFWNLQIDIDIGNLK